MTARLSVIAAATLLAFACAPAGEAEDTRLSQLTAGITRDSALRILGSGAPATDSLANVQRKEIYLISGVPMEILFYSPGGVTAGTEPAPAESTLRPVVLHGDRVIGWGWVFFDSVANANDIRVKVR